MFSVMVVDDEPIVLDSLKTFPWEECGCQVTAWAYSGQTALEQLEHSAPDIMISDIRMPQISGLALARIVKQRFPDVEIVLLTGYAEFDYARQAMYLGIRQYLLKPFRFEDVKSALSQCIQALEERRKRFLQQQAVQEKLREISPLLKEQVYQDLLDGRIGNYSDKAAACNIGEAVYIVISTQSDISGDGSHDIALFAQIHELTKGMEHELYLARGVDIISLILCFQSRHEETFCEEAALHFCEMLQETIHEKLGISISLGISLPARDALMLHQLKKQSVQALNCRQTLGDDSIMLYSDIQNREGHGIFNMTVFEKRIQKCIVQNTSEELKNVWKTMMPKLLDAARNDFSYVRKTIINLVVITWHFAETQATAPDCPYDEIEKLFRCESIEKLSDAALALLLQLTSPQPVSFGDGIAERVIEYLEQHLSENISLDMLSQNMNYSAAYLSRLIKKTSGQSFSELLQELRLKRARELLRESDERIGDIALKTGYNDVSYFISTFKKKTGVTPKEWRSLAKLGDL
ncbi:MAG TPA: response regulator [Candidatus Egerieimonas faecigallinarum]|nr:response regulator [Candidatus Egerieimonas faecigallinarum]